TLPLGWSCGHGSGAVLDEALCVGRTADSFPAADEDYFRDMDYGVTKTPKEVATGLAPYLPGISPEAATSAAVKGRNNWIVWSGARGKNLPVGSYYGYATGIVGLRLFPNPAFDEAAEKRWDANRYYNDASYYNDKKLVKPYRVGMSCGFCHVGPNPSNPPAD